LKPITTEPVPDPDLLDKDHPTYLPQLKLDYINGRPNAKGPVELATFKNLISEDVVDRIIAATNSYAERQQKLEKITLYSRPWKDITQAGIWRYIGC
jgi:hypothetical protein